MSEKLPTIWQAEPHTLAKHKILTSYLAAWAPILAAQSAKLGKTTEPIRFIDAFAGPGVYSGGEDGSPILAIKAALEHAHKFAVPLQCRFIEDDPARFKSLRSAIEKYQSRIDASPNIDVLPPENEDCKIILDRLLCYAEAQGLEFGPALVFLDQFGYSDVPIDLIKRIMAQPRCEVLTYLDYSGLNRFLSDEGKDDTRTAAFGTDEWRQARDLTARDRPAFLLKLYRRSLRAIGGASYVWDFAMCDETGRLLYWLFHCTNNDRGLEEIKKAMWRVDDTGMFRFADSHDPSQLSMFKSYNDDWLESELLRIYAGKTVTVREVREYVLTTTPCFRYASALRHLKGKSQLWPIEYRGRVSFRKDLDLRIRFAERSLFD